MWYEFIYASDPEPGTDSRHRHRTGHTCGCPGKSSHNSISPSTQPLTETFLETLWNTVEIKTIYMIVFLEGRVLNFVAYRISIPRELFAIF